jgi:hypothetical protein
MSDQEHSEGSHREPQPFAAAEGQAENVHLPGETAQQAGLQVASSGSQPPLSSGRQGPSAEGATQPQTRQLPGPNDTTVTLDASWIQSPVHAGSAGTR